MRLLNSRMQLRLSVLEPRDLPTAIAPPPGLVSWWPGDGDAMDIVGGNHGSLENGAGFYQGRVADGFNFDGVDDTVTAATNGLPAGNEDRTISLWMRIDQQVAGEAFLVSYGSPGAYTQVYTIGRLSDHRLFVSTWGPALASGDVEDNQWYHVAASNTGNAFRLYLNSSLISQGDLSIATPIDSTFLIGRQGPGSIGDYRRLDGMVDEVCVFNRALSDAEILDMFQAGRDGMLKPYMVVNDSLPTEGSQISAAPLQFEVDFSHAISASTVQAGDFTVNGIPATSYTLVDQDTVAFAYASSPVAAAGLQTMSMTAGAVQASGSVADPLLRAWTKTFEFTGAGAAPTVQAVEINDGSAQRSRVASVSITFSAVVTFDPSMLTAFTLTRDGGGAVGFSALSQVINGVTRVTISDFTGPETEFGSLRDGRYTLTALAAQISANGQSMAADYSIGDAQGLFRFYGDMNGDRRVDISDFGFFSLAFLQLPNYDAALDFNSDGRIDIADFGQFSVRFFTTLP